MTAGVISCSTTIAFSVERACLLARAKDAQGVCVDKVTTSPVPTHLFNGLKIEIDRSTIERKAWLAGGLWVESDEARAMAGAWCLLRDCF
jgi:hypothetical protein